MSNPYTQFTPLIASWKRIVLYGFLGLVLGVLLSLLRPLEYSATTRLSITQELGTVDAYTASRSAERIADNLSDALYHSVVFDAILDRYPQLDASYFGDSVRRQRQRWAKAVTATVSRGNGLLTIRTYHPNTEQAEILAESVAEYLVSEGWRYTSGVGINIQVVDAVLVSRWPVRPNIPMNAASGGVIGLILASGLVVLQTEHLKRKHQVMFD